MIDALVYGKRWRRWRLGGRVFVAVGVVLAALWVWSGWSYLRVSVRPFNVGIFQGSLHFVYLPKPTAEEVKAWSAKAKGALPSDPFGAYEFTIDERALQASNSLPTWHLWNWESLHTVLRFMFIADGQPGKLWCVPALPVVVVCLGGGAGLWLFARRRLGWLRKGACVACGYDRSGLAPGMACPECGVG